MTTYYSQWQKNYVDKKQFLSKDQLVNVLKNHHFIIKKTKSYRERLYTDYERTKKNKSLKPNYLTEVIAIK